MHKLRILVVDANISFRDAILQVLAREGGCCVVAAVGDSEAAVQAALSLEPDLVLIDIGVSGRSGMKTARQFRLLLPRMQVVLLLSDDHATYRRAAEECGASWVAKDHLAQELRP